MRKKLSKKTWKNIGLGCLAGVLGIGAVMGVGALLNREEDLTKTINPTYAIGGLNEQGRYLETEGSIYTKDAFECQGLDVALDFDSNVSYRIFFYDEENDFISATEKQTNNYDETTTPVFAKFARIVVTPNDDEKISIFEKNGYAKQLTIEVDKEQNTIFDDLSNYDNLAVYNAFGTGGFYPDGRFEVVENELGGFHFLTPVTIADDNTYVILKVKTNSIDDKVDLGGNFYDAVTIIFNDSSEIKSNSSNTYVKGEFAYIVAEVNNHNKVSARITSNDIDIVEFYLV